MPEKIRSCVRMICVCCMFFTFVSTRVLSTWFTLSLSLCVYHNYCIYDDDSLYAEMRKKISSSKLRSIHHAMMPWLTQYVTIIHLVRYYIHAIRVCFFIIIHTVNTLLVDATRSRVFMPQGTRFFS